MEYFLKNVSYDKKASKEYPCKVKKREDYREKVGKGHKVEDKSFLWDAQATSTCCVYGQRRGGRQGGLME